MIQGIEQNPKLGYYKVGDRIFYSKPEAYLYATKSKIEPTWYFNNTEFAKLDWTVEPELSLRELYRLRAQQLRDRYDYIRLELSGGSDSTTVAYSFLLNGIHLDEVVFRYPAQTDKGMTGDAADTSPTNTLSEKEFAADPLLRWISTNFPATKVTVHDYSENLLNEKYLDDESWIFTTRDWFQPGHGIKHSNFGSNEQRALADSGKQICLLYGVDKPKVGLINDSWYAYFEDVHPNQPSPIVGPYTNLTSELFFWTPDLPEIIVKGSHMIKDWFDMPANQNLKYLARFPISTASHRTQYENIVKTIVYPDYDPATWQTTKATNSFYNEMDYWFHVNLADTKYQHNWKSGLKYLLANIDPKYFKYQNNVPVGISFNNSLFFHLGKSGDYNKTRPFTNRGYLEKAGTITQIQDKKIKFYNTQDDIDKPIW
jgi:hypothetical protein